jgi:hypothetical protein
MKVTKSAPAILICLVALLALRVTVDKAQLRIEYNPASYELGSTKHLQIGDVVTVDLKTLWLFSRDRSIVHAAAA